MKITYYGHSCCGVNVKGREILFDPFITPNPNADIDLKQVPANYIICTHGHVDHVADVKAVHDITNAQLISNYEIVEWFADKGVEGGSQTTGAPRPLEEYVRAATTASICLKSPLFQSAKSVE